MNLGVFSLDGRCVPQLAQNGGSLPTLSPFVDAPAVLNLFLAEVDAMINTKDKTAYKQYRL